MSQHDTTRSPETDTTTANEETATATDPATGASTNAGADGATSTAAASAEAPAHETLQAEVRALEAENNRLRTAYAAAQRSRYRRTAIALCFVGLCSGGVGLLVPAAQRVLFAIGATGLFAGVMTYYLSPTQFVAATIGDRLVEANVATLNAFVQTLGLSGAVVYVPTPDTPSRTDVVAFLPQATTYTVPTDLTPGIVPAEEPAGQGIATVPVGGLLLEEFTRALTGEIAREPAALGTQLGEAITDQFELAATVETDVAITGETTPPAGTAADAGTDNRADTAANGDPSQPDQPEPDTVPAGRLTVVSTEPVFATATAYDHPIGSFVASGVAMALDRPVELQVDTTPGDAEYQATVSWEATTE